MKRFLGMVFAIIASLAQASDEGLYPDAIDPNAGFLRVFAFGETHVTVMGKPLRLGAEGLSDFRTLPAGNIDVSWGSTQASFELPSGRHMSLILGDDGTSEMRLDPIANHPGKADVSLINASDVTELSLFVPEAKAEVFSGIAEQEMATRAVTAPLTLDFEFRAAGQTLANPDRHSTQSKVRCHLSVDG